MAKGDRAINQTMPTFLLIHGGWCESGVWNRLLPQLDRLNLNYKTLDLPGHGAQAPGFLWPVTLDAYVDRVIQVAQAIEGPVIPVAHSLGGLSMTAAASRAPHVFTKLVYLTAFAPVAGENFITLAGGDKDTRLGPGVRPNPFLGAIRLDSSVWHDAFFHDCSDEDEAFYSARLRRTPMRPMLAKLKLTNDLASIPKSYILCRNDRAISPDFQRWMANRSAIPIQHELTCGHMPMFAVPEQLAQALATYT